MTKLHTLAPLETSDSFRGILKYYAVAAILGLVIVGCVAYWMLAGPH